MDGMTLTEGIDHTIRGTVGFSSGSYEPGAAGRREGDRLTTRTTAPRPAAPITSECCLQ